MSLSAGREKIERGETSKAIRHKAVSSSFGERHGAKQSVLLSEAEDMRELTDDGWQGLRWTNWAPDLRRNRTAAGYDRIHMFTMGWVYELPFGAGKKFNLSGVPNVILGGWKTNGIFYTFSGLPFNVTASGTSLNMAGTSQGASLTRFRVNHRLWR